VRNLDKSKDKERKKKPYKAPEITSEKVFEVTALACGKCKSANLQTVLIQCLRGGSASS